MKKRIVSIWRLFPLFYIVAAIETSEYEGKLNIQQLDIDRIAGEYIDNSNNALGLLFETRADGFLLLSGLDGEILFFNEPKQLGYHYTSLLGQGFLWKSEGKLNHLLPVSVSQDVDELLRSSALGATLSSPQSQSILKHSIDNLFLSRLLRLLKPLCFTLASLNVTGNSHPGALPLFMVSMRLTETLEKNNQDGIITGNSFFETSHSLKACVEYPNKNQDCFGMCGPSCTCWRIVCGDCCYHQGCAEHDRCCRTDYWSFKCLIPIPFSCSSYPKGC